MRLEDIKEGDVLVLKKTPITGLDGNQTRLALYHPPTGDTHNDTIYMTWNYEDWHYMFQLREVFQESGETNIYNDGFPPFNYISVRIREDDDKIVILEIQPDNHGAGLINGGGYASSEEWRWSWTSPNTIYLIDGDGLGQSNKFINWTEDPFEEVKG